MSHTKQSVEKRLRLPVKSRRRAAEQLVLSLLPTNGQGKRWSDIEEAAQKLSLSSATLARALKKFTQLGVTARRADASTYPPAVYYHLLTPEIFSEVYNRLPENVRDPKPLSTEISKLKNFKLRQEALGALLEREACLLIGELLCVWGKGIASRGKQQAETFYEIMLESYIAPIIHDLGLLCKAHSDVTPDLLNRLFEDCMERFNKANVKIVAVLRAASEIESGNQ